MKIDQSFTFGRTTRSLTNYLSSSNRWKEFCKDKDVIKELIASFQTEQDQIALESWYNRYVYVDDPNCWSRNTPSGGEISKSVSLAVKGKPKSEDHKRKIRDARARQALTPVSHETRLKMSKTRKGRKQTPEWIEKRVEKMRGKPSGMAGKIQTDEHKSRIGDANRGRKAINKGTTKKMVHPEQLESFLNDGWVLISKT